MDYDHTEFLDAYDKVVSSGMFEFMVRALARQKPEVFLEIFNSLTRDKEVAERLSGSYPKVDAWLIKGELIQAIREYRNATGSTLKASKDYCEARRDGMRSQGRIPVN